MNTQTQEALKMAMKTLQLYAKDILNTKDGFDRYKKMLSQTQYAITCCYEALEAEQVCQAQEPFVWWRTSRDITDEYYTEYTEDGNKPIGNGWQPLYTHPAQSWQGNKEFVTLTDDEIYKCQHPEYPDTMYFARAIEQALKEKNT